MIRYGDALAKANFRNIFLVLFSLSRSLFPWAFAEKPFILFWKVKVIEPLLAASHFEGGQQNLPRGVCVCGGGGQQI